MLDLGDKPYSSLQWFAADVTEPVAARIEVKRGVRGFAGNADACAQQGEGAGERVVHKCWLWENWFGLH